MNRTAIVVAALGVFGLAALTIVLGLNLVPSKALLTERDLIAPWYVIWTMIWVLVLLAVGLGVFLLNATGGRGTRSAAM